MRVLELGKFQCVCGKCGSKIEYNFNNVSSHTINHDYLGDYDVVNGIECPVCKKIIKHSERHRINE